MDDLDGTGTLALIDRDIARLEQEARQRAARLEMDGCIAAAARIWDEFALAVKPLRDQREALVMAMARVKSFERPALIIMASTPR